MSIELRFRLLPPAMLMLVLLMTPSPPAFGSPPDADVGKMGDDEFIAWLSRGSTDDPIDLQRLARLFFSIASTLDGGRSSLELLREQIFVPESADADSIRSMLDSRYRSYSQALDVFQRSVTEYLDEPASTLGLYRAVMDGQRVCWLLDLNARLIQGYAGNRTDPASILSSREACGRFRTAVFLPRVDKILEEALIERVYQREEIRELEREIEELERLVEDLRRIEDGG